jgi:hypothetical protein
MRHGLFSQDDMSERNSTESRSDLNFGGLRPGVRPGVSPRTCGGMYIARLEETASHTLKVQITATGPYRYRLGGIVRALLHIETIECSIKNPEYYSQEL